MFADRYMIAIDHIGSTVVDLTTKTLYNRIVLKRKSFKLITDCDIILD